MSVADVICTGKAVDKMNNEYMSNAIDVIKKDCPKEFHSGSTGNVAGNKSGHLSMDTLASLRAQLNSDASAFSISKGKIERIKTRAYYLEDLVSCEGNGVVEWSFGQGTSSVRTAKWMYFWRPMLLKVAACTTGAISATFLLAYIGVMTGYSSGLSFFTLIVHSPTSHVGSVTVFCLATLGYFSFVLFWSLGQMRVAGQMELIGGRETTPKSLSFNARMCCKLAPPIIYSYFGLIYENGVTEGEWMENAEGEILNTAYSELFSEMSVLPVIGEKFNTFFPVLMVILSVLQLGNLVNRILIRVRLAHLQFGTEIVDEDTKMEGKRQLLRHRKQAERAALRGLNKEKYSKMKRASFWGMFKGGKKEEGAALGDVEMRHQPDEVRKSSSPPSLVHPPPLYIPLFCAHPLPPTPQITGWIEKKAPKQLKSLVTSGWQKRMFVCTSPGILSYYDTPDTSKEPHGKIDMRIVIGIATKDKHSKGAKTHMVLNLADREFQLRFDTEAECTRWQHALREWKDYASDFGHEFASAGMDVGEGDFEDGDEGDAASPRKASAKAQLMKNDSLSKKDSVNSLGIQITLGNKQVGFSDSVSSTRKGKDSSVSARVSMSRKKRESVAIMMDKAKQKRMEHSQSFQLMEKPNELGGALSVRTRSGTGLYNTWAPRYFELAPASGNLNYWKREADKTAGMPALGCVDLHLVLSIEFKKDSDKRIELDLGDDVLKVKGKNAADSLRWRDGLQEWQEYILLNMDEYDFSDI